MPHDLMGKSWNTDRPAVPLEADPLERELDEVVEPTAWSMVPVLRWTKPHIWLFLQTPMGVIPTQMTHKQVKKHIKKIVAPSESLPFVGKIDPHSYTGPDDIFPLDWEPAHGLDVPAAPQKTKTPATFGQTTSFKTPDVKAILVPKGWKLTGNDDQNGESEIEYLKTGFKAAALPGHPGAWVWAYADAEYLPYFYKGSELKQDPKRKPLGLMDIDPQEAVPKKETPDVAVPEGCQRPFTTDKGWIRCTTGKGDVLKRISSTEWRFYEAHMANYGMAMNGAVHPAAFTPGKFEDPAYPGSLIGKVGPDPGFVLTVHSDILDSNNGDHLWWNPLGTPVAAYYTGGKKAAPAPKPTPPSEPAHDPGSTPDVPKWVLGKKFPDKFVISKNAKWTLKDAGPPIGGNPDTDIVWVTPNSMHWSESMDFAGVIMSRFTGKVVRIKAGDNWEYPDWDSDDWPKSLDFAPAEPKSKPKYSAFDPHNYVDQMPNELAIPTFAEWKSYYSPEGSVWTSIDTSWMEEDGGYEHARTRIWLDKSWNFAGGEVTNKQSGKIYWSSKHGKSPEEQQKVFDYGKYSSQFPVALNVFGSALQGKWEYTDAGANESWTTTNANLQLGPAYPVRVTAIMGKGTGKIVNAWITSPAPDKEAIWSLLGGPTKLWDELSGKKPEKKAVPKPPHWPSYSAAFPSGKVDVWDSADSSWKLLSTTGGTNVWENKWVNWEDALGKQAAVIRLHIAPKGTLVYGKVQNAHDGTTLWDTEHGEGGKPFEYKQYQSIMPKELDVSPVAAWSQGVKGNGEVRWDTTAADWNGTPVSVFLVLDSDGGTSNAAVQTKDVAAAKLLWTYKNGYTDDAADYSAEKNELPSGKTIAPPSVKDVIAKAKSAALPPLSSLTIVKGKGSKLGGAGYKEVYTDGKKEYIWKPAIDKGGSNEEPFRAAAQAAFANFATQVRPDHIGISLDVGNDGKVGTLQELVPLADDKDLRNTPPTKLTDQEQEDVAVEHMLDWVMSQHDSHKANLVRTEDGRVVSIDKEQGWKYVANDRLDIDFHPNAKYGESEPYYNTFWRDFKDGKINFDPMKMASSVLKIEDIGTEGFIDSVRPYADMVIKDPLKKAEFLEHAVTRKLNVRRDFEEFLTKIYEEKNGEPGDFTFDEGWTTDAEKGSKQYVTKTFSAKQAIHELGDLGLKEEPHDPSIGASPSEEPANPDWTVLKIGKEISEEKLAEFLEEFGVELAKPIFTGPQKHIAVVTKSSFAAGSATKKIPVSEAFAVTPEKPKYWPDVVVPPPAEGNVEVLEDLTDKELGRHGKRVTSDGGALEGQTSKVARWQAQDGTFYYRMAFKLRKKQWSHLKGGIADSYSFQQGIYDKEIDAYVEKGAVSDTAKGKRWNLNAGGVDATVFVATGSTAYAYMGATFVHMPATVKNPRKVAVAALNSVKKGLGTSVFKPMSKDDEEVLRLSRLLWALAPQAADALTEDQRTVPHLTKLLSKLTTKKDVDRVKPKEVFPGYHTFIQEGRWKDLGGDKVRFLFNGITSQEAALSVMQTGLMGIIERNLAGIPAFGGSYSQDVGSGSGDGILARVVTESGLSSAFSAHNFHGAFQVVIHPKVLDRLDTYMYNGDTYGRCRADGHEWQSRKTVSERVKQLSKSYSTGNEISLRKGVHPQYMLRLVTSSEPQRKALIAAAVNAGIEKVNGVPISDYIAVCTSCGEAYNRYVKPLGLRL
jgi:hypothetical protein